MLRGRGRWAFVCVWGRERECESRVGVGVLLFPSAGKQCHWRVFYGSCWTLISFVRASELSSCCAFPASVLPKATHHARSPHWPTNCVSILRHSAHTYGKRTHYELKRSTHQFATSLNNVIGHDPQSQSNRCLFWYKVIFICASFIVFIYIIYICLCVICLRDSNRVMYFAL